MKNLEDNLPPRKYSFSTVIKVSPAIDIHLDVRPHVDPLPAATYYSTPKVNKSYTRLENWKVVDPKDAADAERNITFTARGGILADEMGLGKTMTVISLIQSNPREYDDDTHSYYPLFDEEDLPKNRYIKTTLVVCPSQLVTQWGAEIKKASNLTYKCCNTFRDYETDDIPNYDVLIVSHTAFFDSENKCKKEFKRYHWYSLSFRLLSSSLIFHFFLLGPLIVSPLFPYSLSDWMREAVRDLFVPLIPPSPLPLPPSSLFFLSSPFLCILFVCFQIFCLFPFFSHFLEQNRLIVYPLW